MKEKPCTNLVAAIQCTDDDTLGYLFEIVTSQGMRLKVTFDSLGFVLESGVRFSELPDLLSHICKVHKVRLLTKSGFSLNAGQPECWM